MRFSVVLPPVAWKVVVASATTSTVENLLKKVSFKFFINRSYFIILHCMYCQSLVVDCGVMYEKIELEYVGAGFSGDGHVFRKKRRSLL